MARALKIMQEEEPTPEAAAGAPPIGGERTVRLTVSGMTCAACQ